MLVGDVRLPRGAQKMEGRVYSYLMKSASHRSTLAKYISNQVKSHRKRMGITISELAEAAHVSNSRLSKIERGHILPSLSCLQRIARALNRPLTAFIPPSHAEHECCYVKSGRGVLIERQGTQSGYQSRQLGFSASDNLVVEASLVSVDKSARAHVTPQESALKLIHMLTGKLLYRRGNQTYFLESGDTLLFDAIASHGLERLTEAPISYLSIAVYPREV